jgi:hypothetical protein
MTFESSSPDETRSHLAVIDPLGKSAAAAMSLSLGSAVVWWSVGDRIGTQPPLARECVAIGWPSDPMEPSAD